MLFFISGEFGHLLARRRKEGIPRSSRASFLHSPIDQSEGGKRRKGKEEEASARSIGLPFPSLTSPSSSRTMDLIEPLMDAVINGEEGLVQLYISLGVNLATATDHNGRGVLHWSAASEPGEQMIPYLISRGAKLNLQDHDGFTPLHAYAIVGRTYGLAALLNNGADPNIFSYRTNLTPLHVAVQHNRVETANLLLCYGGKLAMSSSSSSPPPPIQALAQMRPTSLHFRSRNNSIAVPSKSVDTGGASLSSKPSSSLGDASEC